MTKKEILQILRNQIIKNYTLPFYEKDLEFYNQFAKRTNCYAYAFQWRLGLKNGKNNYMPGFLSNSLPKGKYYSYDTLTQAVINDGLATGLSIKPILESDPYQEEFYRVYMGYSDYFADGKKNSIYHFVRENDAGVLSEKPDWYENVRSGTELVDDLMEDYKSITIFEVGRKRTK